MTSRRREPRWLPTWRVWLLLALYAGVVVWLQVAKPIAGDQGGSNLFSILVAILAVLTLVLWFLFFSGHRWWVRLTPLLAIVALVAACTAFFRIERVSGDMIPSLVSRSRDQPDERLEARARGARVDLTTTTGDDFPQFLGPNRHPRIDHVVLARDWNARPPELVWRQPIGAGWSGFAVVNGYAVTLEQRGEREMVTCYDAATGELQWAHEITSRYRSLVTGDGPRTTPTIDDGVVYALGAFGHLWALDGATGEVLWEKDLRAEYGLDDDEAEIATFPYGRSNSPLVVGDLLIVPPGGPAESPVSLVAYHKKTGGKVWEGHRRQISCSSPAFGTLLGVDQVLSVNEDTVSGHDPATGELLWEHPWEGRTAADANVSQPVPLPPDRVFVSKGYGLGASLLELRRTGAGFTVEPLWQESRVLRTKFTNVAIRDGHVYGLSDGILECVELATGRRVWKDGRYRHGQILMVGELLLVLAESGELFLVEATPERANHVLGSVQALDGTTWNTMALYGDLLLVRNGREAAAYRLPLGP